MTQFRVEVGSPYMDRRTVVLETDDRQTAESRAELAYLQGKESRVIRAIDGDESVLIEYEQ